MYFRRTTYIFSLLCISLVIYLFQYIDTENRKGAPTSAVAGKSNPFYNSTVENPMIKRRQHNIIRQKNIIGRESDTCKHLRKPSPSDIRYRHKYWQVQQDGEEDVVVYSAFHDDRPIVGVLPWIRILGVRRLSRKPLWCHVWYPGKVKRFIVKAEIVKTGRSHSFQGLHAYSQNMFSCLLDKVDPIPSHVSIATQPCGVSSTFLPIVTPKKSDERSNNFGACLSVNFGYIPPERIVEWMEVYSMFGLTQVNVYNASFDAKLDRVFDYYRKKGFVEVRQMSSPVDADDDLKGVTIIGSPTSLNDCMMRNMYTHRFIVIVDFDEIIVPRLHSNYLEMVDHLDSASHLQNSFHTYSFRNAYFFQHFPEDDTQPKFLRTMRLRYRAKTSGFLLRSKPFIDPRRCKSIFNNYCLVRSNKKDFQTIDVNTSIALSHHYRSGCPFSRLRCEQYEREKVQDDVMLRYKDELLWRVSSAMKAIGAGKV